jgi:hypothetical protein
MARLPDEGNRDEPVRTSWHGLNQPKPKLPYYLRSTKRLKSLDEFEEPEWKGRVRFHDKSSDEVTVAGVARETLRFLIVFAIIGLIVAGMWRWAYGTQTCIEPMRGFKIGWC